MRNNKSKRKIGPIQIWGEKVNWGKRVKAVCKPCWEIKYCPYGPLVEMFPLKEIEDEKSCRLFGHNCPVFYVAEPLTETKELRNISRSIPRKVQFKVLKRDNQICFGCGKSVLDENVEFDHIIPWSKGGSSEDYNIKLLCKDCNRKKGNRFEDTHLVKNLNDRIQKPIPFNIAKVILMIMKFAWENYDLTKVKLTPLDFCKIFKRKKVKESDKEGADTFNEIIDFFTTKKPIELSIHEFKALKYRWGFIDKQFHTVKQTSQIMKIDILKLIEIDKLLIERLGFYLKKDEKTTTCWLKT